MELAIAIQAVHDVTFFEQPWVPTDHSQVEQETMRDVYTVLHHHFGELKPTRLYFGSEFCQYRLPQEREMLQAYDYAVSNQLSFTLVTPYLPQAGLQKLKLLIKSLTSHMEELNPPANPVEVVVNDWGTLHFLHREYPQFELVLGRLLNKMIRDPRVTHLYQSDQAPEPARQALQESSTTVGYFRQFVEQAGVKRIELDNMIQGLSSLDEWLPVSLHLGYGCVATGRSCLVGTLHKPKESKFKGDVRCKQQCRHYLAELVNTNQRLGSLPTRMFQKGNSVFYVQEEDLLKQGLSLLEQQEVNRLVYSPRIPV